MPINSQNLSQSSEEIQEIITAVPKWIVRWGITLVFAILLLIIVLSALIRYPDVINSKLIVNSTNAPKRILSKQGGKLVAILIKDGQQVSKGQPLAYFETTANPGDILKLHNELTGLKKNIDKYSNGIFPKLSTSYNLGEIQNRFQVFYQEYMQFMSTRENGYHLRQIAYLQDQVKNIERLKLQISKRKEIESQQNLNAEKEYLAYKRLFDKKVISRSEFTQQENLYLASKYPLEQSTMSLIDNSALYIEKQKEISTLRNTIVEQNTKFMLALNQCIADCETWINQYILKAPIGGKVSFAGTIQQNQNFIPNQEVLIVDAGDNDFFGEIELPQYSMGKVHEGAPILVKLKGYPFEQYGMIRGKLTYLSNVAYRDSIFLGKVSFDKFENKDADNKIILKNGMLADAEIIIEESSLLRRFFRNIIKILNSN
jgi:multidrug resistance efflux pump